MTSVLMDLPVKASEAAALAELIFLHADGKRLNDDLRNRLAGRAQISTFKPTSGLWLETQLIPRRIMAADGRNFQPPLLHIALASAPTGIFPNALLIGRMATSSSSA